MSNSTEMRHAKRSLSAGKVDVFINGKVFSLYDVSLEGLSVVVKNDDVFFPGQRIEEITLTTADRRTKTFKGIVSHITKTVQHVICGLRFELTGPEDLNFLVAFNQEISL
jgi:hypothetical protein